MRIMLMFLLAGSLLPLAGCTTERGGTTDQYSTNYHQGEDQPAPAASPTFRPGMNREDPRDPQFATRPEATPSQPPPGGP